MSPQARMAAGNAPLPDAGVSAGSDADAGAGPFVLNLTSSTTPMALAHPEAPELKRFSFFVSRRREDNRERFRLHMGYFSTLAEAEEWLNVIRDLYPGAWAGEAPGKKLRARAAAAELAKQLPPPPPVAAASAARPAAPGRAQISAPVAPPAAARPAAPVMPAAAELVVPTLQAAPALPPVTQATAAASAAPMLEAVAQAAAALAAAAKTVAGAQAASPPISFTYAPPPNPLATAPVAATAAKAAGAAAQKSAAQISAGQNVGAPVAGAPAGAPGSVTSKASATPAQVTATRPASAAAVPGAVPAGQAGRAAAARPGAATVSAQAGPAASPPPRAPAPKAPVAPTAAANAGPVTQSPAKGGKKNVPNALTEGSNVREVMASLDETTGETRQMRIPPGLRAPAAPAARAPAGRASPPPQGARSPAPEQRVAAPASRAAASGNSGAIDSMSDTQVLRMLETRRPDEGAEKGTDDANSGISLLKPDDTQTRRALKEAVIENAPVAFAVQLQWSVQPVDLASVPPLAIFSAYTLYTVEGSREGRKWYGLRLGFFSDAISAKQVAYYVRSEFNSVAVVPVSPAEKARATDEETKAATGAFQRKNIEKKVEEFKLFDDEKVAQSEAPKLADRATAAKPAASSKGAPARKNKPLGRVRAKEQRSPKTLEETLEILGASDLEIDNGRGEVLNDTGVRHLRVEVQKNTPFAKLLDRISERVRKN